MACNKKTEDEIPESEMPKEILRAKRAFELATWNELHRKAKLGHKASIYRDGKGIIVDPEEILATMSKPEGAN